MPRRLNTSSRRLTPSLCTRSACGSTGVEHAGTAQRHPDTGPKCRIHFPSADRTRERLCPVMEKARPSARRKSRLHLEIDLTAIMQARPNIEHYRLVGWEIFGNLRISTFNSWSGAGKSSTASIMSRSRAWSRSNSSLKVMSRVGSSNLNDTQKSFR